MNKKDCCDKCKEHQSMHSIWRDSIQTQLCCKCYVENGYPPADWHILCMETYNLLEKNKMLKV